MDQAYSYVCHTSVTLLITLSTVVYYYWAIKHLWQNTIIAMTISTLATEKLKLMSISRRPPSLNKMLTVHPPKASALIVALFDSEL